MAFVHVACVNHRHGVSMFADYSRDGLYKRLYDFVKDYWHELPTDEDPPEDKMDAVDFYFENHPTEYIDFDVVEL